MQNITALREFEYGGRKYLNGHSYNVNDETADYLVYRNLVKFNGTAPKQPAIEGENKILKRETVAKRKPFPVSKRK